MADKKVTVQVDVDAEDSKVKAIDEELRRLKQQRLQLKIDAGKDELEEAEAKIKGLKTFLDNVNHSNTNIHINDDEDEEDFDQKDKDRGFDDMSTEDQIADLNIRVSGVEGLLGIDPDDEKSLDKVAKALDDAGYEKPEPEEEEE